LSGRYQVEHELFEEVERPLVAGDTRAGPDGEALEVS